ncbi:uncharacterized protein MONBRDRAFT_38685 [Monosiga brevicollis MX1]|uniref:BZIP domain-containing protein n=1 Tax=Monosiga brevicollis TaxID=81824 RepID=A9V9E3_MONBE|nr:uncharacterized protein MONBRDRAFT_38685 [Monosiga brevicollis MX1]EDQ85915.1 predicted protein [Monosiga brevicollis MX1]|eukprot:XP_001749394.1 hypothetical protein [Monosiga brevicollis MX1]
MWVGRAPTAVTGLVLLLLLSPSLLSVASRDIRRAPETASATSTTIATLDDTHELAIWFALPYAVVEHNDSAWQAILNATLIAFRNNTNIPIQSNDILHTDLFSLHNGEGIGCRLYLLEATMADQLYSFMSDLDALVISVNGTNILVIAMLRHNYSTLTPELESIAPDSSDSHAHPHVLQTVLIAVFAAALLITLIFMGVHAYQRKRWQANINANAHLALNTPTPSSHPSTPDKSHLQYPFDLAVYSPLQLAILRTPTQAMQTGQGGQPLTDSHVHASSMNYPESFNVDLMELGDVTDDLTAMLQAVHEHDMATTVAANPTTTALHLRTSNGHPPLIGGSHPPPVSRAHGPAETSPSVYSTSSSAPLSPPQQLLSLSPSLRPQQMSPLSDDGYGTSHLSDSQQTGSVLQASQSLKDQAQSVLGHTAIVERVLQARTSSVHMQDRNGWSSLHWAVASGALGCVRAILQADALNLALANDHEETVFHFAARRGNIEVLELLIEHHLQSKRGRAHHHAKWLTEVMSAPSGLGYTPEEYAEQGKHDAMVAHIRATLAAASSASTSPLSASDADHGTLTSASEDLGHSRESQKPLSAETLAKRVKRRDYMRQRRQVQKSKLDNMEDKVSALEQHNQLLNDAVARLRADAAQIEAALARPPHSTATQYPRSQPKQQLQGHGLLTSTVV